jgi:L-asparaginase
VAGTTGGTRRLGGKELLKQIFNSGGLHEIDVLDFMKVRSSAIRPADMCALAHEIHRRIGEGTDGIVVTQGTDTLEETAYALALQLAEPAAIVLTGAMRTPHQLGADGPANLVAALRVATTPGLAAFGPVVVMQDQVHLARLITKGHSTSVSAFSSPVFGPVGYVAEEQVRVQSAPPATDYLGLPGSLEHRVELVWTFSGCDGSLLESAAARADGVVIAAMGGGHVPPDMVDSVKRVLKTGVPVVMSTRCGAGPTLSRTYRGVGSERQLVKLGVIPAGDLSPLKTRLRLIVALALGRKPQDVFPAGEAD